MTSNSSDSASDVISTDSYHRIYYLPEDSTYQDAIKKILSINKDLKADGIWAPSDSSFQLVKRLYSYLGSPIDSIPVIHVGGTNGKGSTSFKLARALQVMGMKTGLFVSPHIASFRERMQCNATLISEADFVSVLQTVFHACRTCKIPATEFELMFFMASVFFWRMKCDVVVLEVGLGGEVDATNVVTTSLSIICSVSLDHTRILGSTLDLICDKKAGIFKNSVPALIGPNVPETPARKRAEQVGAQLFCFEDSIRLHNDVLQYFNVDVEEIGDTDALNTTLSLLGLCFLRDHLAHHCSHHCNQPNHSNSERDDGKDEANMVAHRQVLCARVLQALERHLSIPFGDSKQEEQQQPVETWFPALVAALRSRPPCRWEKHVRYFTGSSVNPTDCTMDRSNGRDIENPNSVVTSQRPTKIEFVLDMGHNPAAITALKKRFMTEYATRRYKRVVCGMSRDKDTGQCVQLLSSIFAPATEMYFVQATYWRAATVLELAQWVHGCNSGSNADVSNNANNNIIPVEKLAAFGDVQRTLQLVISDLLNEYEVSDRIERVDDLDITKEEEIDEDEVPVVIICGSGYIMPDTKAYLGIKEPKDVFVH